MFITTGHAIMRKKIIALIQRNKYQINW